MSSHHRVISPLYLSKLYKILNVYTIMQNNCSFIPGPRFAAKPYSYDSMQKYSGQHTLTFFPIFPKVKEEFAGSSEHSTPLTPGGSFYAPPSDDDSSSEEISFDSKQRGGPDPGTRRDHLNAYLCSRDISPVRSQLQLSWQDASDRTKRYYVRKAGQGLSALVQDIAPAAAGSLYKAVCSSKVVEHTLGLAKEDNVTNIVDETMMNALAECYRAADDSWETRRQILSILADKLTLNQLRRWIPDLSQHCFTEAKRHCLVFGRGLPVHTIPSPRMKVSLAQIDHFVAFITSPHIVQDLPFGERRITLSTKETVKVPNVVRMLIPERIVKQYTTYCQESQFKPLSRSTLLHILNVCAASVCTSLQGIDYVSSAGAEAFDELCDVVETLGHAGQEMTWAKLQENNLRASKRYLKSDYKVRGFFVRLFYHVSYPARRVLFLMSRFRQGRAPRDEILPSKLY